MIDLLNEFFSSTYAYNKFFYIIRVMSAITLAGMALGFAGRLLGWVFEKK